MTPQSEYPKFGSQYVTFRFQKCTLVPEKWVCVEGLAKDHFCLNVWAAGGAMVIYDIFINPKQAEELMAKNTVAKHGTFGSDLEGDFELECRIVATHQGPNGEAIVTMVAKGAESGVGDFYYEYGN